MSVSVVCSKSCLFKDFIVFMLSSIRAGGYFCFKRKDFNSTKRTFLVNSSKSLFNSGVFE